MPHSLRRILASRSTLLAFTVLLAAWTLTQTGWLSDEMYAILYPFWLPGYFAVLLASGLRNVSLPWLGSGLLFTVVASAVLYLEAVLLAGMFRTLRHVYRTSQRGRSEPAT